MSVAGLHHVTLVCSDARRTAGYYTRVLGLRLLKRTVDLERIPRHRLYFGNWGAEPGSIVSFVERPGAPPGEEGVGGTHHFALLVETREGLLRWKRRLTDLGIAVNGPLDRHYFESIYHRDPDGAVIEIATRGAGWTRDEAPDRVGTEHREPPPAMVKGNRDRDRIEAESWSEAVPEITGAMRLEMLHHVTAIGSDIERCHAFLHGALGMRRVKRTSNFDMPDSFHWYWGVGEGAPGTVVTYFERRQKRVRHGPGQTRSYALAVEDEASLREIRERLLSEGLEVSGVVDRGYFHSISTRDPDGQRVELATRGPGFAVDEPRERLGRTLCLPPGLESDRERIEARLGSLNVFEEER